MIREKLFWLASRTAFSLYKKFPLFGDLRASVGIIEEHGRFLVIHRNDGRGFSFPGGIANPFEPETATLVREVREETGLSVENYDLLFRYRSGLDVPCRISVFRVRARGVLRASWEGKPEWVDLAELQARVARSQRPIVDRLMGITVESSG